MNRRKGLDARALRTEWQRLVSPQPKPAAAGRPKVFMVIRPNRESATGWTRRRKAVRATSHYPLNEHGWALNAFWLPVAREEGVRILAAQVATMQTGLAPGLVVAHWHQMGD